MKNDLLNDEFTHFDNNGYARMVDVGNKNSTQREAVAFARVLVNKNTFNMIKSGGAKKGDVLSVAQIAGITGAKHTASLIPMCHNIIINAINVEIKLNEEKYSVDIFSHVKCDGKTGVEMEAMTAVSIAALTVYDMCKAIQRDIVITDVRLESKSGGTHGDYERK
ncbi:MAG: cyclic pyranopterin monophosphate synthase MoaC [Clostridiales bacterium]|nr:MAG: cyclic pyranopterin monophosphate synthase MoaC [Clostridiales bacterium]